MLKLRDLYMRLKLRKLLAKAKGRVMSDKERAAQRISFAYGNTKMSNDLITRELVASQAVDLQISD